MSQISSYVAATAAAVLLATGAPARAAGTADPAPQPSPTPAAVSDPCTTLLAVVSRPSITTAACNVKRGDVFLETGYTNTTTSGNGASGLVSYPNAEIRAGLIGSTLEVDFFAPSASRLTSGGSTFTGTSDAGFGLKLEGGYTAKSVYGAFANVTVPTGDAAFTGGISQFAYGINYSYAVTPAFAFATTLGYNQLAGVNAAGAPARYGTFVPSLIGTLSLPMNTQAFAEVAHYLHAGYGLPPRTFFDAGLQHDIGSFVQLDVEYGTNFNAVAGAKSHYVGAGAAFRFGS